MEKSIKIRAWVIWSLASIFFFYEFFLRVTPSIIVPELMRTFKIGAGELGTMAAFYLYVYAPLQLPVGMLVDRFGARKLLTSAASLCGFGGVIFGGALYFWMAELGRFFIGVGSAFAFISMVYVCSHWFPPKQRSLMIGLGNSMGMLGAVAGEGPLNFAIEKFGWRASCLFFGFFGIALALCIYIALKRDSRLKKTRQTRVNFKEVFHNLRDITARGMTWVNSSVSLCMYLTTSVFAALWAPSFFQRVYGISIDKAGFASSMIFIGWLFGGPLFGKISDYLRNKRLILFTCSIILTCIMLLIIAFPVFSLPTLYLLLFLVGLFSGGQLLTFSYSMEIADPQAKGTASAFVNCMVMLGAALFQPLFGIFLDLFTIKKMGISEIEMYTKESYQMAALIFPLMLVTAAVLSLFLKEKPKIGEA